MGNHGRGGYRDYLCKMRYKGYEGYEDNPAQADDSNYPCNVRYRGYGD